MMRLQRGENIQGIENDPFESAEDDIFFDHSITVF